MKLIRFTVLVGAGLLLGRVVGAQITPNQIVQASVGIVDQNGTTLPGSNPFGPSPIPGCLVQILNAGANAVFDLPNLDGTPSGDDTVIFTTQIGQGIATNMPVSGPFSTAFTH